MGFQDKVVLISGAGAGIGQAAALAFASQGVFIAVNAQHENTCKKTVDKIRALGGRALAVPGDISVSETARRIVDTVIGEYGRLDILVNNAGIVLGGAVHEVREEDWARTMDVNINGVFYLCRFGVMQMLKQGGGVIVNVSSILALRGLPDRAAYSASKGAVAALSRAMAADYLKENIRVNCICPGTTLTPSLEQRIQSSSDPKQAALDFANRQPIGRLGTPDEIAEAILFAASDKNSFMTGAVLTVDGGMCL